MLGATAEPMDRAALADLIVPPFSLGEQINDKGVYSLLNSGGAETGYVFETEPLAPLPGFSGAPTNALMTAVAACARRAAAENPIFGKRKE